MFEQKCILYPSLTFLAQTKLLVEAFCGHGQNILFQLRNINIVFSKSKRSLFFLVRSRNDFINSFLFLVVPSAAPSAKKKKKKGSLNQL